jgi:acetylornithine deacetylase/succinyl-diaminopimelate desuccinylase-like protein
MELMVMVLAKRQGLELNRDLLFVAVADEESGGHYGVGYLQKNAPHLLDGEYVFNEGAYGFSEFMGRQTRLFGLGPSEKSPCWLKLVATGTPGHASVPHPDNAVVRLVRALGRIEEHTREARLTPTTEAMLACFKRNGFLPEEMDTADIDVVEALGSADAHLHAITHDTVNLTGLSAGKKHNVIPVTAEATLDCRLLPDTDPDSFVAGLEKVIDDPKVEIVRVLEHFSGTSSMDTPAVSAVYEAVHERFGDEADVIPVLSPGFTDSHAYRASGAQAYGFIPCLLTREELITIHGHNERISQANLRLGIEMLFDVSCRLMLRH